MKLNYYLFLVSLVLSGQVYAERLVISDIMSPENLENIRSAQASRCRTHQLATIVCCCC